MHTQGLLIISTQKCSYAFAAGNKFGRFVPFSYNYVP